MIHVCSLAALSDTVKATGASHVLTVMANVDQVQRPVSVLPANHLKVQMDDITDHEGTMRKYLALCRLGGTKSFTAALEHAGLRSPFDESVIADLAASSPRRTPRGGMA